MGVFLFGGMLAGCIFGFAVTAVLGAVGLAVTIRLARTRVRAWRWFAVAVALLCLLCLIAVHMYPYPAVRPGSDYDVAMKNLFLQGLGYCASPGLAALLAALATMLGAKKRSSPMPSKESGKSWDSLQS